MYYTVRSLIPDFYNRVNPKDPEMIEMRKIAYWVCLPQMTDDMYRVMIFKLRNKDMIEVMDPKPATKLVINLEELRLKEDVMFGDITIFDMDGITFSYMSKLTPSLLAKVFTVYEVSWHYLYF